MSPEHQAALELQLLVGGHVELEVEESFPVLRRESLC